jgi:hypothetical protein
MSLYRRSRLNGVGLIITLALAIGLLMPLPLPCTRRTRVGSQHPDVGHNAGG